MTLHYFKVCPRGFSNEVIVYSVDETDVPEVEKHFANYINEQFDAGNTNAYCGWTDDPKYRLPWMSVDWADARTTLM